MKIEYKIKLFREEFDASSPVLEELEYLGSYHKVGDIVLGELDKEVSDLWSESIVPDFYKPVYELKCGDAEMAGGLFSGAPFSEYDPEDPMYGENMPAPKEKLYDFCTDSSGSWYWLNDKLEVFGLNLNYEISRVGSLEDFVSFALDQVKANENWYDHISDPNKVAPYSLTANAGFD